MRNGEYTFITNRADSLTYVAGLLWVLRICGARVLMALFHVGTDRLCYIERESPVVHNCTLCDDLVLFSCLNCQNYV